MQATAMQTKTRIKVVNIAFFLILLLLSGCAAHYSTEAVSDPYGLFSGIWHGAISGLTITVNVISWFLSLGGIDFFSSVQIIGRPNTGFFYYIGFAIGFMFLPLFR
jgi:hypothetical protein